MAPRLRILNVSYNGFSGPIPRSLPRFKELQALDLYSNNLTGVISEELGMISGLKYLVLGYNLLGGSIPASLGKLQMLQTLDISSNDIVSTPPLE